MDNYTNRPYERRDDQPAVSIYLLSDDARLLQKLSCMFCKNTLCSIKGTIDKVVNSPMPADDFDQAIEIVCKKCKQMWRLCVVTDAIEVIIPAGVDEPQQR